MDLASTLSAVIWPAVFLIVLFAFRERILALVESVTSRVGKVEFAGFSLELARARPFLPDWAGSASALDLRHRASAVQVNDSTVSSFVTQLNDDATGDYAEINLGGGREWLTSRLFIMAIVLARMQGIGCFVFVETAGSVRKRFVGWADPARVRWALAKAYPWLEAAYADAYAAVTGPSNAIVVSGTGRLGRPYAPRDPAASIDLLREFLSRIQQPTPPPEPDGWHDLASSPPAWEHARWIDAEHLERLLRDDLGTEAIHSSELRSRDASGQMRAFLSVPAKFVAVLGADHRFEYLVRRDVLLEQAVARMAAGADVPR